MNYYLIIALNKIFSSIDVVRVQMIPICMYPIDWYLIEIKATSKYGSCNKLNRNNEAHTIITPIFKRFALGENQYLNERIKPIIVKG